MTNADLIWRLVEKLLQNEKDLNQVTLDKVNDNTMPNSQKQNEV